MAQKPGAYRRQRSAVALPGWLLLFGAVSSALSAVLSRGATLKGRPDPSICWWRVIGRRRPFKRGLAVGRCCCRWFLRATDARLLRRVAKPLALLLVIFAGPGISLPCCRGWCVAANQWRALTARRLAMPWHCGGWWLTRWRQCLGCCCCDRLKVRLPSLPAMRRWAYAPVSGTFPGIARGLPGRQSVNPPRGSPLAAQQPLYKCMRSNSETSGLRLLQPSGSKLLPRDTLTCDTCRKRAFRRP